MMGAKGEEPIYTRVHPHVYSFNSNIQWIAGFLELVDYFDVHYITGMWGAQPGPRRCPDGTPEAAESSTILMEHECCDVGEWTQNKQ